MTKDLDINDRSVLQALRADAEAQLACPSRSQSWADAYHEFVRAVDRLDAMWARVEIGQAHIVASEGLGEPIAATPAPALEAANVPAGFVLVNAGALQMVRNALQRDADDGRSARGEMLAELDAVTKPAPAQAQQPVNESRAWASSMAAAILADKSPGSEWHMTMMMAPHQLHAVVGQDREHLLAFARDVWNAAKAKPEAQQAPELERMTAHRVARFLERFLREEKMLGPNEQAALWCVIAQLEAKPEAQQPKGLTTERLRQMHHEDEFGLFCDFDDFEQIARAVEQEHGIGASGEASDG
jgi:hypothetical protein